MLIQAVTTIALYCPRCGKLQLHDISHFAAHHQPVELLCSCRYKQATIMRAGALQYVLQIPCVLCQSTHRVFYDRRALRQMAMEKIYCPGDNFELGYIGQRVVIEETLRRQESEFCRLEPDTNDDEVRRQRIMLEVLNKVHDIASEQHLVCLCGSQEVTADLLPEGVLITCLDCGGYQLVPASTEEDVAELYKRNQIVLTGVSARFSSEHE